MFTCPTLSLSTYKLRAKWRRGQFFLSPFCLIPLDLFVHSMRLLAIALPLVRTHGFTREALANSVCHLPPPDTHNEPLSDAAVSALFGFGDSARRTLINSFFDHGIEHMKSCARDISQATGHPPSLQQLLQERLDFNRPVIHHLPEAFALLASPQTTVPPLDPLPALKHALRIADEACHLAQDRSAEVCL